MSSMLRPHKSGNFLPSHTAARAVLSAPESLTSVFGMGTGVTSPILSPENLFSNSDVVRFLCELVMNRFYGQVDRTLVQVS